MHIASASASASAPASALAFIHRHHHSTVTGLNIRRSPLTPYRRRSWHTHWHQHRHWRRHPGTGIGVGIGISISSGGISSGIPFTRGSASAPVAASARRSPPPPPKPIRLEEKDVYAPYVRASTAASRLQGRLPAAPARTIIRISIIRTSITPAPSCVQGAGCIVTVQKNIVAPAPRRVR